MKRSLSKSVLIKLIAPFLLALVVFIIHSCKKDFKSAPPADIAVEQAKAWYESAYPASINTTGKLVIQSAGSMHDLSQWIKPDWQHPASYKRLGKNVIEMPIDPGTNFHQL